jgi:hypothetical protein
MSVLARRARGLVLLLVAGSPLALFAQNRPEPSQPFLVTMGEVWSTPQPAAGPLNAMNCVIVFPDGRLHLELRRQEFFEEKADLSVFEGSLNGKEIQILRDLLDAGTVAQMPLFTFMPTLLSGAAEGMQMFSARISRGKLRQQVGYFVPAEGGPAGSSEQKEWSEAATALRPLVEWFRALKSAKPRNWRRVSNANSNLCEP